MQSYFRHKYLQCGVLDFQMKESVFFTGTQKNYKFKLTFFPKINDFSNCVLVNNVKKLQLTLFTDPYS